MPLPFPATTRPARVRTLLAALVLLVLFNGCTSLVVRELVDPLSLSLERQTDLRLIDDGAPALLLIIDGLISTDPGNLDLLIAGARAYAAYCALLQQQGAEERIVIVSQKAKIYGQSILHRFPAIGKGDLPGPVDFPKALATLDKNDVEALFWAGYAWSTWILAQQGAPAAMIDLPYVEQIMLRVVALDETYYHGGAHLFLGVYYGSRPEILGGRLELSRSHFERALVVAKRCFLPVQVAYAETYARMSFNRKLFADLLNEVLAAPATEGDMAASNRLAKQRAEKLLAAIDDYF
ncbi:MAG: TRAP transporter TatT component family protein [Desulfobacterales bacterium]|nr:TRAP transporter TatT component family protein [Desulfobacterales bacterium]